MQDSENPFAAATRRTLATAGIFFAMAIAKLGSGWLFGSLIIEADGLHSLIDVAMVIMIFLGLKVASRPPSERFQFGLYKAENLVSFGAAIAVGAAALEILFDALHVVRVPEPVVPILVEAGSVAGSYWIMLYLGRTPGMKLESLKAQGVHAYEDVLSSLVVIVGILGEWLYIPVIAILAAFFIAGYILVQAFSLAYKSVMVLLDVGDQRVVADVKQVVTGVKDVLGVHDVKVRQAGPFYFLEMHLEAPPKFSVQEADRLADEVEKKIKQALPTVASASIHVEPGSFSGKWVIALFEAADGSLRGHAATAPYVKIVDERTGERITVPNPAAGTTKRRGLEAAKRLKQLGVEAVIVREIGEGMLSALKGEGIMVLYSPASSEEEALEAFRKGELRPLETAGSN
ncbi:MAG: cation diffusion facilitator family transporter [Thermoprotei archaeon]|nr:cation diffusion facilitator family transporter [TACK group archaeon]